MFSVKYGCRQGKSQEPDSFELSVVFENRASARVRRESKKALLVSLLVFVSQCE